MKISAKGTFRAVILSPQGSPEWKITAASYRTNITGDHILELHCREKSGYAISGRLIGSIEPTHDGKVRKDLSTHFIGRGVVTGPVQPNSNWQLGNLYAPHTEAFKLYALSPQTYVGDFPGLGGQPIQAAKSAFDIIERADGGITDASQFHDSYNKPYCDITDITDKWGLHCDQEKNIGFDS